MSGFLKLLLAASLGYGVYEIFKAEPTPTAKTDGGGGGGDVIEEDLPGDDTLSLPIEGLLDKALARSDMSAKLAAEGMDKPSLRAVLLKMWYGDSNLERAEVSTNTYAMSRNVELDWTGDKMVYVATTKPALSLVTRGLLRDISDRYAGKATALTYPASAPQIAESEKITAAIKEHRRAADEAAAKGESVVGPAGILTDDGDGAGGGGGLVTKPYEPAMTDMFMQSDVQTAYNASARGDMKQQIERVWATGSFEERVELSNDFYGLARGVNVDPDGMPEASPKVTMMSPKVSWSPRTYDDMNALSDVLIQRIVDTEPTRATDAFTVAGAVRTSIDTTALASVTT